MLTSLALLWRRRNDRPTCGPTIMAALAYAGMIGAFFILNRPVNEALNGWTVATLPANWTSFRARWEIGHASSALLSVFALVAVIRAALIERDRLRRK